jgi:hypothetical protein
VAEVVRKAKVATAPPTTKVSPGVLLQVQVQLTSQQCKVQETVEVSDSTEVALPPVSATLEAPELTNLESVEEEESTSSGSGASTYHSRRALRCVPERGQDLLLENQQGSGLLPLQHGQD